MNTRNKLVTLTAIAAAVSLALGGCSTPESSEPVEQSLVFAPSAFPETLDIQQFSAAESTQLVADQVLDALVFQRDGEFEPRLATSWENPDPNTWIFTLREGVEFSDGTPFTSADVRASMERIIEIKSVLAPLLSTVTSIDDSDPGELVITTSAPLGTLLATLSLVFVGKAEEIGTDGYWQKPIGTGPFKIDRYTTDDVLTLSRNETYWGEPAKLDTLEFRSIPEASSRITALETGEVDLITNVAPDQANTVASNDGVTFEVVPSFYYYLTWFNQQREPFTDERVRQAMWHAVDLESIIPALFGEAAAPGRAPLSSEVFGAPELDPYEYDPELATELLADAGLEHGFRTTMMWPNDAGVNVKALAQAMISAWAEVGITVEPIEMERANWTTDLNALNWDMTLFVNSTATGDADYTLGRLYTCAAARLGFCDPEIDGLLAEAKSSLDQDEREALYAEVSEYIWDNALGIFPAELTINVAYRNGIQGLTLPPSGRIPFALVSVG